MYVYTIIFRLYIYISYPRLKFYLQQTSSFFFFFFFSFSDIFYTIKHRFLIHLTIWTNPPMLIITTQYFLVGNNAANTFSLDICILYLDYLHLSHLAQLRYRCCTVVVVAVGY